MGEGEGSMDLVEIHNLFQSTIRNVDNKEDTIPDTQYSNPECTANKSQQVNRKEICRDL